MAKNLAIVAGVSTAFVDPKLTVIEGTETSAGVMPASSLQVKSGLLVEVRRDPDGSTGSGEVTGDPKVYSYQNEPKNGTANIVFERYYYTRTGGTPSGPFSSVIQVFDSSLLTDTATLDPVINGDSPGQPNQYLTKWGGGSPTPANTEVVNAYGVVRLGEFIYVMSYDFWRVTKINAGTKAVVGAITFNNADYNHATPPPATVMARGQGIKVHDGKLYALFNVAGNINGTEVNEANYQPSILVEIDTANFTFKDKNHASPSYAEVGMNSVKIESTPGFLYCPAIGGPQLAGESNIDRSGLYRVPVVPNGALGTALKVYKGNTDPTFYDIRDVAVGDDYALILTGRFEANYGSFSYILFRISRSELNGFDSTQDIYDLFLVDEAIVELEEVMGYGPYHSVKFESAYKHFWCGQSIRIRAYDESVIANISTAPTPGAEILSSDFYGGEGYINSMEVFIDNTEAHASPTVLRAAAAGGAEGQAAATASRMTPGKITLRAFMAKRKKK